MRWSYLRSRMNLRLPTGIRHAHDAIMIGNAAIGFMPSRLTSIRHGAYRPMPSCISAPSRKLTTIAKTSTPPLSPSALPPGGSTPTIFITNSAAATSSAMPMPSWIARRGSLATMPAPR